MKKFVSAFLLLLLYSSILAQKSISTHDASFREVYTQISLRSSAADGKKIIRKWDRDLKIFAEYGITNNMKEELEKIFREINPLLGDIKIVWAANKDAANFIITFDKQQKTTYNLTWDVGGNIQRATANINTDEGFNADELQRKAQQFLVKALGNFAFKDTDIKDEKAKKCNLAYYKIDLTPFDLEVIKFHYSKGVETGMYEKDLEGFLKKIK